MSVLDQQSASARAGNPQTLTGSVSASETMRFQSPNVRILTRYILGEILSYALIGCAVFTFILFIRDLTQILETVVRNSSTFGNIAGIFMFNLPNTFKVTIPMAVLVGILLGLSRLAADSEIIAMRASGLGIWLFRAGRLDGCDGRDTPGPRELALRCPRANRAILEMQQELETSQASYEIQPRVFYEDFRNASYMYKTYGAEPGRPTGTGSSWPTSPIRQSDHHDRSSATVVSDSTQELLMRLRNGSRHETISGQPQQYNISSFSKTDLPLRLTRRARCISAGSIRRFMRCR